MRRSATIAVASCALALLAAACGTASPPQSAVATGAASASAAAGPMPAGTEIGTPDALVGSTPLGGSCGAARNVAPTGPLPEPGHMPAGSTMARILSHHHLTVGVDETTLGFGYLKDGKPVGFDDAVAAQVALAIFGNPNAVQYVAITSAQRIPDLKSGAVDLVADNMTITCDRLAQVGFSEDYYNAGQTLLVASNFPAAASATMSDLRGQRVCAAATSTSINEIGSSGERYGVTPVSVPNWPDCLVLLQQGQVAAISTDNSVLVGLRAQDADTVMSTKIFTCEPHGLAMPPNEPDFVRFVNGVLEQMRTDGEWQRLYSQWVKPYLGAQSQPPAQYNVAVEQTCSWLG